MRRILILAVLFAPLLVPGTGRTQPPPPPGYGYGGGMDYNALIDSWSRRYLHRASNPRLNQPWVQQLENGDQPETILSYILGSNEYYTRAGGNDAAYVRKLYTDVTGRPASPQEMGFWVNRLRSGDNLQDVAYDFLMRHPQAVGGPGVGRVPPPPPDYDYGRPDYRRTDYRRPDYYR